MIFVGRRISFLLGSFLVLFLGCNAAEGDAQETSCEQAADVPLRVALLVGINEYKYQRNLRGAVNDVEAMRQLLVEKYCFKDDEEHIKVLTDKDGDRDQILNAIDDHLIARVGQAEEPKKAIVLFHFSGHGSQMTDEENGDEQDGMDETLVTWDSDHDTHPNNDITDDEINARLRLLTDLTPNVTFIFDSCHSGSATRGAGAARTVKPDTRAPPERADTAGARGATNKGASGWRPTDAKYVLISGSAAHQLSREMRVNRNSYGALTWHLTNEIRNAGEDATYQDVMDLVRYRVNTAYPSQTPQLEGAGRNQLVFNDKSRVIPPYVLTNPRRGNTVELQTGLVHGATKSSVYDVYPPGYAPEDGEYDESKRTAQVELSTVQITSSRGRIINGGPVTPASRAIETEHQYPDIVLNLHIMGVDSSATLRKVGDRLSEFAHIRLLDEADGYDLLLREHDRSIVIESGVPDEELAPRVPITDADAAEHVVDQIKHWARWYNTLEARNEAQSEEKAIPLDYVINAEAAVLTNPVVLSEDIIELQVTNRARYPVYITILNLSSDGSVTVVYPDNGEPVTVGETVTREIEMFVPGDRDFVRDILRVIATTRSSDFSFLELDAVKGGPPLSQTRGGSNNPLEQLYAQAGVGNTRGMRRVPPKVWATKDYVIEVRR